MEESNHRRLIKGELLLNFLSYHYFVPYFVYMDRLLLLLFLIRYYLVFPSSLFGLYLCRTINGFIVVPTTMRHLIILYSARMIDYLIIFYIIGLSTVLSDQRQLIIFQLLRSGFGRIGSFFSKSYILISGAVIV